MILKMKFGKKLWHAALMATIALAAAGLQACANDDDNEGDEYPYEILGDWTATLQNITVTVEGLESETTVNEHPEHILNIKPNGEIISQVRNTENGQWETEYRGAWAYNPYYSALVIAPTEDERLVYYVRSVDATSLVLVSSEQSETEDGTPCTIGYATLYIHPQQAN